MNEQEKTVTISNRPMNRLVKLQNKLNTSGIKNHPVIDDDELIELSNGLNEIINFFIDRGDITISIGLRSELNMVDSVIRARDFY